MSISDEEIEIDVQKIKKDKDHFKIKYVPKRKDFSFNQQQVFKIRKLV